MNVSISYEDQQKKILLTDSIATIYKNFKILKCKSATACKAIIETLYIPQRDVLYDIYLRSPKLSSHVNSRLEIVDEYETYVFDVDKSPQKIKDFVADLERQIRHSEWETQKQKDQRRKILDKSVLRFFRKNKNN